MDSHGLTTPLDVSITCIFSSYSAHVQCFLLIVIFRHVTTKPFPHNMGYLNMTLILSYFFPLSQLAINTTDPTLYPTTICLHIQVKYWGCKMFFHSPLPCALVRQSQGDGDCLNDKEAKMKVTVQPMFWSLWRSQFSGIRQFAVLTVQAQPNT